MTLPLLHSSTNTALQNFLAKPSHALLLVAPAGTGKTTVALYMASQLLATDVDKLLNHPHFKLLDSPDGKSISIDAVRDITHFMSLRTTGRAETTRVVVIEHSQLMTTQAQNALLKTIEEPPAGTVIILTAPSELGILPTIRSRIQKITLQVPDAAAITAYFTSQGYTSAAINKALLMSDALPGLTSALLASDTSHPLVAATAAARDILQKTAFERITLIDDLAKQRQLWLDTLFMLGRMSDVSMRKDQASVATIRKWQKILAACHEAQAQTLGSAQLKLVMLNFMLAV